MSESEWAPKERTPKSAEEQLDAHFHDRENPDDIDRMVQLPGDKPAMIEVPDWNSYKAEPKPGDAGYEKGFDDDPFAKGKEVQVKRNGKNGQPDYVEGGWKIVDNDASVRIGEGKYTVGVVVEKEIDGEMFQKSIKLQDLMELNSRTPEAGEKQPLSEAQEDIADEAIEDAIGLQDPSEVDGDARMYAPGEIKAMREAAARIVDGKGASQEAAQPSATEVQKSPQDILNELTKGLSADDQLELRSYAEATQEVVRAQKEGRGEDSTYWQQIKGQSLRAMSPRAQSVANRYAGFYDLV